jgi:hypothetical protein
VYPFAGSCQRAGRDPITIKTIKEQMMPDYPENNVQQLINAGVLKEVHNLSEDDQQQINSLSSAEINHLISVGGKLDEDFYERNADCFSRSNFI